MTKHLFPLLMTFTIFACTTLSPKGAEVVLLDAATQLPSNCSFVTNVESAAALDDFASSITLAKVRLRNEAAEANANYVVISNISESFLFVGSAIVGGKSYLCTS